MVKGQPGRILLWLTLSSLMMMTPKSHSQWLTSQEQELIWADLSYLAADQRMGRKPSSSGHQQAREYIIRTFQQHGLSQFPRLSGYRQVFSLRQNQSSGVNLLGYIPGRKYPDKYWFITAHYDHLGSRGGRIFNGANDNASGVAAMLSLVRYFSQHVPEYSLVFVATDAEETGLQGAKYLLAHLPVDKRDIMLNVNIDMIGHGAKRNRLFVTGANGYPQMKQVIDLTSTKLKKRQFHLVRNRGRKMTFADSEREFNLFRASDHRVFAQQELAFLYFGAAANKHYHTEHDELEQIARPFLFNGISAIIEITSKLQTLAPSSLLNTKG